MIQSKGFISVELLLNFLIYLIVVIFLLQISLLPLQILFIEASLRKAVLVYMQIGHYKNISENNTEDINFLKPFNDFSSTSVKEITKEYIRKSFPNDTFAGKIIDVNKLEIKIEEENSTLGFIFPKKVTITLEYPFSLFNAIDFSKWIKEDYRGLYIKRKITFMINP